MKTICTDLREEYDGLERLVASLSEKQWQIVTPFYNWTIYDEVSHISFFDGTALLATRSRSEFGAHALAYGEEKKVDSSMPAIVNRMMGRVLPVGELISLWRKNRGDLLEKLESLQPKDRLPWYGPDMSALSFATARLMETWAHAQDIYDALRVRRENTDRIKHVAHLGVTTFGWSFSNRQLEIPPSPIRVELLSPSGQLWTWGPDNAEQRLSGKAEDFCLVVTQRRHVEDTGLEYSGTAMATWLRIAQCFAGGAAHGPCPGVRVVEYGK
jgi:uncharacterized protein (TIGR03084 family)